MTKQFKPYGLCNQQFQDASTARGHTYTTRDDILIPSRLVFDGNPYNKEISEAKNILDFGCGVGRNLSWVMENTQANYVGIDPNTTMTQYFWELQDKKYQPRAKTINSFNELQAGEYQFDVVIITFVFQHLGYRNSPDTMNISDMTQEIKKYTHEGTIWWMLEHQGEEQWYSRWKLDNNIENEVIFRNQQVIPELTHRGNHDLILWKQKEYPSRLPIQSSTIIEEE